MASLRWVADGIEAAERAGGVTLERYRRPGFTGGPAVRVARSGDVGAGPELELVVDPEPDDDEDEDD